MAKHYFLVQYKSSWKFLLNWELYHVAITIKLYIENYHKPEYKINTKMSHILEESLHF